MTTAHLTTPAEVVTPPAVQSNALARAQAAGDRAYNLALAMQLSPEVCADAYHRAFALKAWVLDVLPPCDCDHCIWLREDGDGE
jgi:hypothetical protein